MAEVKDLSKYDIILAVDKSGSMAEKVSKGATQTKWEAAKEATVALATKAATFDDDGITVAVFANNFKEYENINDGPTKAASIFDENEPNGGTDTAKIINHYANEYLAAKTKGEAKPVILLIVTDGVPNDERAVVREIIALANKLDNREEFGIQFLQIGDDAHAHKFLKELDDNLTSEGAKLDIVDTKTFDEMENLSLAEVLLDALTD